MTSIRLIFILVTLLTISSCLPYAKVDNYDKLINVNEIREQKFLDRAIPTDYMFFFNKMINQRLSKLAGNNWEIYLKDSLVVYYGYDVLTKKGIYADTIYSITKSELEKQFPLYDKMKFWEIRNKLLDYAYKDFDFGNDFKITFAKDIILMTSHGIEIRTQRKFKSYSQNQLKRRKGEIQFEILVDKLTLKIINKSIIK
jgi:hypothetical protein